jgi:hypothetical protein
MGGKKTPSWIGAGCCTFNSVFDDRVFRKEPGDSLLNLDHDTLDMSFRKANVVVDVNCFAIYTGPCRGSKPEATASLLANRISVVLACSRQLASLDYPPLTVPAFAGPCRYNPIGYWDRWE